MCQSLFSFSFTLHPPLGYAIINLFQQNGVLAMAFAKLTTLRGEKLPEIPWETYPRPQMKRESYVNLNGTWDFAVSDDSAFPADYDRKILVPFCPESQLSGIGEHFPEGSSLFYRKKLVLPEGFRKERNPFLTNGEIYVIAKKCKRRTKISH